MKEQLAKIRAAALEAIADSNAAAALDSVRVKYLGKKGELTSVLKQMGKLSAEERPVIGQIANEVRETLTKAIADQQAKLAEKALEAKLASETLDVSIPGVKTELGHRHPVNQVIDMVTEIFLGMGFTRAEGPLYFMKHFFSENFIHYLYGCFMRLIRQYRNSNIFFF